MVNKPVREALRLLAKYQCRDDNFKIYSDRKEIEYHLSPVQNNTILHEIC